MRTKEEYQKRLDFLDDYRIKRESWQDKHREEMLESIKAFQELIDNYEEKK